jgi:hypothetical protein
MSRKKVVTDFDTIRLLLRNAAIHFKLVFGLRATRPSVSYLDTFSFGRHVAHHDELALTPEQEEHAFAALEHCATYITVVQVHTVLEAVHPDPFHIKEPAISAAFQISRLIRNAFAHNPFAPVWKIRSKWEKRVFIVPDVIALSTAGLDGQPLRRKHYGGPLAILRLITYTESVVLLRAAVSTTPQVQRFK